jgi:guanylate kinase
MGDEAPGAGLQLNRNKKTPSRLVVVGPDAAGKSTLVLRLRQAGFDARSCAQDHSYVPDMWRRLSQPRFLIFLDASLETIARRRPIAWGQDRLNALQKRLAHARQHCDLYVDTDEMTVDEVIEFVKRALFAAGIQPQARE